MRRLVNELTKLPSIGEKSAVRLAYHILTRDPAEVLALADSIRDAREKTMLCSSCFAISESEVCAICTNPARDRTTVCVVEKPSDVIALERSGGYRGLYHVLHGLWSPLRGVQPEQTKLRELVARLRASSADGGEPIHEIVLATGTTVEGDATALYIARAIQDIGVTISRIAQGLPKGGELEYADEITLSQAMEGRRTVHST